MVGILLLPVLLSLSALAAPHARAAPKTFISLPVAKRVNATGSTGTILQADQARAKVLKAKHTISARDESVVAKNNVVNYVATVGVGFPATNYELLVDTGSSNTWVGAITPYTLTGSSQATNDILSVTYGSGFVEGKEFFDTVTLSEDLVILSQSIGVTNSSSSSGTSGLDGILGLGPVGLTADTLSPNGSTFDTVVTNAYKQNHTSSPEIGIAFQPSNGSMNGQITFGAPDTSLFVSPLNPVPITTTSPASSYIGVDQQIIYGANIELILESTAGIFDTGTTLMLMATDAFNAYQSAVNATMDEATGLLTIPLEQYSSLQSLFFYIGGMPYELVPNAQIWPRSLNTAIGGEADAVYLIVGDLGSTSGEGLDFINGMVWLERFFVSYNSESNTVGIATTQYTQATTN